MVLPGEITSPLSQMIEPYCMTGRRLQAIRAHLAGLDNTIKPRAQEQECASYSGITISFHEDNDEDCHEQEDCSLG